MRNVKRLIAVIMAVIMLFSVVPTNVFAATGSKNLISTDKAVYELGEQFKITVRSYENSNDWVAVYNATSSTTPINGWYYVNHWYYPEKDGTKDANGWSYTFDSLGAGYYRAYLLKSDGYEVMDYVDFEIKSNSNLSLDKEVYHVGEAINVTATGSGADLVGLYRMYENHGSGGQTDVSKYWYYVAKNGHTSGSTYQINTAANIQDGHTHETLPAGEYKVHLFPNDSYDSTACKKFTIVDHTYNETQIAKKATFTDAGVIKTVCSCGAENGSTTAIPAVSDVTLEYTTVQFENGKTYTPAVTVKDSTGASVAVENYDVAYTDNDKPGMAKAIITLKGDKYEGSKELSFEINEAANICSFDTEAVKVKATFDTAGVIANKCVCGKFEEGSEKAIPAVSSVTLDTDTALTGGTPSVTVKDSADKALVKDTDYTVSYSNNGSVGTATATVTLKGEFYEGTKAVNYNVIPFTVNKTDLCYGEDLIVKSKDCGNSSCIGIYKDGEGYNPDDGGKHSIFWQYTSAFDAAGVCFSSNKGGLDPSQNNRSDTLRDGYLAPGSYKIVFFADGSYGVVENYTTAITVSEHNYSDVSVTAKATLDADGSITKTCKCGKYDTEVIAKVSEVSISGDEYPFAGEAITPAVTVKDSAGNTLTADDYTVAYASNNAVGKGSVTVTLKGNLYSGTVTKEFDIKLATPTIKSGKYQNGIVVKWSVVAGATGYNVYRKDMTTEGADWEKIATTVGKSYIDTKLTSGNAYSYKVEAYFRGFNSASKETKAVVYLSIPTVTTYNAAKGITVEWDAQDGATRYHVFRRDYINGAWSEWVRVRTTETTSFVDAKAISGTRYQYKVYSATETDKSIASAIVLELRLATTTVKASNASGNAKITWSKVKGTTTYDVMRRTYTNGKWSAWKVVKNTSSLSYIDKSVKSGTKYQYKVVAKNGTKYVGAQSAAVTNLYLAASASIKATVAANGYKLTWSKVTGAASYNVYRSVYKNGKWTSWTKIANTKSLSYTDKNLTSGTNCKYKVVAVNGTYTSAGKGTANMRFVAPTAKVTATGTSKGFNVSWSKVAGAKGYYVYRREYKNGAWSAWTRIKTVNSGSTVKLTDTKNVKNVKYQYSVKAFSGSFTSALTISSVAKR